MGPHQPGRPGGDAQGRWAAALDEIALLQTREGGEPLGDSRGGVEAGLGALEQYAELGPKAVLELGGKDPMIVDAGVDPAWAAGQAATGCFANASQICTSVERIYVHRDLADAFVDELVARAKAMRIGAGTDPDTDMGPLIDDGRRAAVHAHAQAAVEGGAELCCGGAPVEGPGSFYPPTVLTGVRPGMAVVEEETFGPVAAVQVVGSFDEALSLAAGTAYGLAAVVLTADMGHAMRATRELPVGTVR